jgi:hypothetical protein
MRGITASSHTSPYSITPPKASGVYWIQPTGYGSDAFQVYCEMEDGGGWVKILHTAGTLNWDDSVEGYGDVTLAPGKLEGALFSQTCPATFRLSVYLTDGTNPCAVCRPIRSQVRPSSRMHRSLPSKDFQPRASARCASTGRVTRMPPPTCAPPTPGTTPCDRWACTGRLNRRTRRLDVRRLCNHMGTARAWGRGRRL